MKHCVIWSGGCDSTTLLLNLLYDQDINNKDIIAYSVEHPCLGQNKIKHESEVRKSINALYNFVYYDVKVDCDLVRTNGANQSAMWASYVTPLLPASCIMYFGYIRGDDFWHYRSDFEAAILSIHKLRHGKESDIKIEYPLEWWVKSDVLNAISTTYKMRWESLWWCEHAHPKDEPCGKCTPCLNMTKAIEELKEIKRLKEGEIEDKDITDPTHAVMECREEPTEVPQPTEVPHQGDKYTCSEAHKDYFRQNFGTIHNPPPENEAPVDHVTPKPRKG